MAPYVIRETPADPALPALSALPPPPATFVERPVDASDPSFVAELLPVKDPFRRLAPASGRTLATREVAIEGLLEATGWTSLAIEAPPSFSTEAQLLPDADGTRFLARLALADGDYRFTLVATGSAGSFPRELRVGVDTVPPALTVRAPAERALLRTDKVVVEGTVSDRTPCTVLVNSRPAEVSLDGRFVSPAVRLEPGDNRIDVVATDAASNRRALALTVTRLGPRAGAGPAAQVRVHPKDGAPMCHVPAGPFLMGEKAPSGIPKEPGMYPAGASPFGCYDMAGCLEQWCADWYDFGSYARGPETDPRGPASESPRRPRRRPERAPRAGALCGAVGRLAEHALRMARIPLRRERRGLP